MTLPEAIAILCQVHTVSHPEMGFIINSRAAPEEAMGSPGPMKSIRDYEDAWELARRSVGLKV